MTGSPEELAASLRALADEGISHVQIFLMPTTPATVDGFGDGSRAPRTSEPGFGMNRGDNPRAARGAGRGGDAMLGPPKPRRLDEPIAVSLEDLVPPDHFYRHLEATLDLSFVREWARELYAERGRPSIDPVVFFKLQLVMFFEGIRSERKLIETASLNLAHPTRRLAVIHHDGCWRSDGWTRDRPAVGSYRRTTDFRVSTTDPDATPMRTGNGTSLGYHDHYVVDGGKAASSSRRW